MEKATGETVAFEYIVRKQSGELLSVTQRDETPLVVGAKVLVIAGSQARIVADYTVPPVVVAPVVAPPVVVAPVVAAPLPVAEPPVGSAAEPTVRAKPADPLD